MTSKLKLFINKCELYSVAAAYAEEGEHDFAQKILSNAKAEQKDEAKGSSQVVRIKHPSYQH